MLYYTYTESGKEEFRTNFTSHTGTGDSWTEDKSHRSAFHVEICCVYQHLFSRTKRLRVIKLFLA